MPDNETSHGEIDALAQLVAATNANLKVVDDQIVSGSTNLQKSQNNWDPHAVLKDHLNKAGSPPSQSTDMLPPAPGDPTPPTMPVHQQGHVQTISVPVQVPTVDNSGIYQRLDAIAARLSNLEVTFDKILNGMLKNKTKQITIKFDDSKN